jgi:type VI protein secretion system component VasK
MTKRSRRKRRPVSPTRRALPPFRVRWAISSLFVLAAIVVSMLLDLLTDFDQTAILMTSLVILFILHIGFYHRLMAWYVRWEARRAAQRSEPATQRVNVEPPRAAAKPEPAPAPESSALRKRRTK